MTENTVIQVNDATFEAEVLQSDVPVLVEFGAAWCSPCQVVDHIFRDLAGSYAPRVRFCAVDIVASPVAAINNAVLSVPKVMLFHHGALRATLEGVATPTKIRTLLDTHLN